MSELDDDTMDWPNYTEEFIKNNLRLTEQFNKGKNNRVFNMKNEQIVENISIDGELEKLDYDLNEQLKYDCYGLPLQKQEGLSFLLDVKTILVLMASEIKTLNLELLKANNTITELKNKAS